MRCWVVLVGALVVAACGDDGGGTDAAPATTVVSGRVWAPKQNPLDVMVGQEIPVAGALVYLSTERPSALPDQVYCERCAAAPSLGVTSGADGSFRIEAPSGRYWLVVQKGPFRVMGEYDFAGLVDATYEQTTLPTKNDLEHGMQIPRIAMARGSHDKIETVLEKLGLSNGVDGIEVDTFEWDGTGASSVAGLISDMDALRRYHLVFFPCQTAIPPAVDTLLRDQAVLANLRRYVNEGGKLYVTDWSGEVADRAFPQQLQLGDTDADSVGTYDATTFGGTLTTVGTGDGDLYGVTDARASDVDLANWLGQQIGPDDTGMVSTFDPTSFAVPDVWNWIAKTNAVQIGVDAQSSPVYDAPKVWLTGSRPNTPTGQDRPLAVTYQPTGCGKVLYTPFQTTTTAHFGLTMKERVLLYLVLEISTCTPDPFE